VNTSDNGSQSTAATGTPTTISQLIASADFHQRWFDLGRRVRPLPASAIDKFEAGTAPWPYPYLRQAWCGLLMWPSDKSQGEPAVWFLRLPLDEQGKLLLPIRDRFLHQVTAALTPQQAGTTNGHDPAKQLQQALEGSELTYTPPPERRAVFHAKAAKILQRPASEHLAAARAYAADPASRPWEQLAMQGIADLCVRWQEVQPALERHMPVYAAPVFNTLCQCLESETIDHRLTQAICARAQQQLHGQEPDLAQLTAAVRGISYSQATGMRRDFLLQLLESDTGSSGEILAAIASRCCDDLQDVELADLWLKNLAGSQPQETFNLLLTDLLFLPEIRSILLDLLRNPERPDSVARAFGSFLNPGEQ